MLKAILEDLLLAYGPNLPIAIVKNKIDNFTSNKDKKRAEKEMLKKLKKHKHPLFTIFVKTGKDLLNLLQYLLQQIMRDKNLEMIIWIHKANISL